MASNIGIKIANGDFYPLIEENSSVKKKLILTTVHDNQPSVQIDLYRTSANLMSDAQYIGSLVLENINPKPKGEPSIEMVVSSNSNGEIVADAFDLDSGENGEHYILTVSLKSFDETARDMEIPDFELDSNDEQPSSLYNEASKVREKQDRKFPWWIILLIVLLLLLCGLAAWMFFFGGKETVSGWLLGNKDQKTESVQTAQSPQPVRTEPAPAPPPPEPVVITAPETPPEPRPQPAAAVQTTASSGNPSAIPREGINYTIRWGDTLWDISEAYYRDPWQYPRIAQHNNIANPNLIISGRTIKIPPKN